jgi:phosphoglycerate dehydrogenase-like enzyme
MSRTSAASVHALLKLGPEEAELVARRVGDAGFSLRWLSDERALDAELPDIEVLFVARAPEIDWSRAPKLRLLQVAATGVDPLFTSVDPPPGVWVANTRGAHALAVRDHALALLLAFARDLPRLFEQQRRHEWRGFASPSVAGRVLTLVGLGSVGSALAAPAASLGLHVRAVRRQTRSEAGVAQLFAPAQLVDALAGSDYVVLCVPSTRTTRRLIGAAELAALPAHAVLINVSRGELLDTAALEAALRAGTLRGAALDVFDDEPLPASSSLWTCPGLLITPHVAGWTPDYLERVLDLFVENLRLYARGEPPRTLVSPDGY